MEKAEGGGRMWYHADHQCCMEPSEAIASLDQKPTRGQLVHIKILLCLCNVKQYI